MTTLLSRAALAAAAMALGLSSAHATTTATGSLAVSLQVTASCSVGNSSLTFNQVAGGGGGRESGSGTIYVTCSNGTVYNVTLDQGSYSNMGTRRMASGGSFIAYSLYTDAAQQNPWSGTVQVTNTGTGGQDPIPVYGQANWTGLTTPGTYTDTVTITVSY